MHYIYILYFLLSPLIFLELIILSFFSKKIRDRLFTGNKIRRIAKKELESPIVFHAASAGEFEQIKPVLRGRSKTNTIIQTFFSPTIYNKEKESKLFDYCCYHPFDFPWTAYLFFKRIKPVKYIINRHDIWPHHIFFAKKFNVQIIYINANLKSDSLRLNPIFKSFHKWLFKKIDIIIAPSNKIKNRFDKHLDIDNLMVCQDTRNNQIKYRMEQKKKIDFSSLSDNRNIILGSIDNKDWEIILDSLRKTSLNNFNLIIVPHEIDNHFITQITKDIKELNLSIERFTKINDRAKGLRCIIYDKIGDLLDIYKYGNLAYVGCGFSSGVHNVLEPALQGCYVSYGPNISLLDEAIELKDKKLIKIIYNSDDFKDFIKIEDIKFLDTNKSKVDELFENKKRDFEKMRKIIYE